jgi:hypothetical protein
MLGWVYPSKGKEPGKGETVDSGQAVVAENDGEKKLSDADLKKECYNYARKNFQGKKFINQQPRPKGTRLLFS